ncbi:FAD-binding oxidoreductase [Halalkalibacter akibai]|uniref:Oxidoreductase n=1 Tax=Halalkalibacter akibai (strain ATCC 43226 / DSM 21942 / CIP 109018 / JCM 9157 / 1139) TaxID=1236973 RepID=W4QTJ4_HALA3|nr:FAD-binding oxidoreductase [Halalkalibacter akibai]GAE35475.1 oxidoreductase [Halalkalibacter akibai JCM 9157]
MAKYSWLITLLLLYVVFFSYSTFFLAKEANQFPEDKWISDVSGLMPVKIKEIKKGKEEESFVSIIQEANDQDIPISIAGKRHSMGGHTYYHDAIILDMTSYNQILEFDPAKKRIRVQSGATWDDIQRFINPYGLAVKVMQSQNIFTIGGSLSVNAHGRDIRYGSLIDTVHSFRLLTADGEILTVSRNENAELFPLVIGGYGLFGVILDVELILTQDELYLMRNHSLQYDGYAEYFINEVKNNPDVRMHLARISTATDTFLTDMYVTDYTIPYTDASLVDFQELKEERFTWLTKFSLGLSRHFEWGRTLFWNAQKNFFLSQNETLITRNNVMRSESKFLEYESESNTDVLQEYFIPVENFTSYIDDLRELLSKEELNLVNITIRYVSKNEDAVLSYAKEDMFALVLLINQGFSNAEVEETQAVIRKMIDLTLDHDGSYYLPYMPYPTKKQMLRAYPRAEEFFKKKQEYDPSTRFINFFYERYGIDEPS